LAAAWLSRLFLAGSQRASACWRALFDVRLNFLWSGGRLSEDLEIQKVGQPTRRNPFVDRGNQSIVVERADLGPPLGPSRRDNPGGEPPHVGLVDVIFERTGFVKREGRLEKMRLVVEYGRKNPLLLDWKIRVAPNSDHQSQHVFWIEGKEVVLAKTGGHILAACRFECSGVLTNLDREVGKREDNRDSSDEISEVSEYFENVRLLRPCL
jgi:hypothetical protein